MFRCARLKTPVLTRGLRGRLPELSFTLEQRLAALSVADSATESRVNIGFVLESNEKEAKVMSKARNMEWKLIKEKFDSGKSVDSEHSEFSVSNEECSPAHYGNIIPCADLEAVPEIHYDAEPDHLFTIVMTALDSHLESNESEYLHWLVGNIPGNEVHQGTLVCDYLRPFMPKGTGYHRFAFVLYKQAREIDFSKFTRPQKTTCLRDRTFRTIDFYRALEDQITPCGLVFFQSTWDDCLVDFFHKDLQVKVPVYEHVPLEPTPEKFKKFPENEGFNTYIDKFRDPKEIGEDIYCRRLKKLDPFMEEPPPSKYPHAQPMSTEMPSWLRIEMTMERDFAGKFQHMKRFSLLPEGPKRRYKPAVNLGIKRVL